MVRVCLLIEDVCRLWEQEVLGVGDIFSLESSRLALARVGRRLVP